jgi:hypothetical protein
MEYLFKGMIVKGSTRVVGATWPQEMIKTTERKTLVLSLLSGYPHMAI